MIVTFLGADLPRWDQLLRERGAQPSCLGLPFFEDERPLRGVAGLCDWRLGGRLSRLLGAGVPEAKARGELGDKVLMPTGRRLPFGRIVLLGLGPAAKFDEKKAREASRVLIQTLAALVEPSAQEVIANTGRRANDAAGLALVPPGRSTGVLSARRALEILLEEAEPILADTPGARIVIVESTAGQKEAAELIRKHAPTADAAPA